ATLAVTLPGGAQERPRPCQRDGGNISSLAHKTLSYKEAVLRAVDGLNQRSSDENLYRLLELDPLPKEDEDPDTPKPVSFTVKETVCPRTTQQPLEECDFKENGLVKQCVGTVVLDPAKDYFDISCDKPQPIKRRHWFPLSFQEFLEQLRRFRDQLPFP
uniref:Uncharacterized protein n=1 Tax=Equus caballus TaxID=9796 RepID=A0A9L0R4I8_HORSE